jgi:DNA-directed RNA polymerase subunit delta
MKTSRLPHNTCDIPGTYRQEELIMDDLRAKVSYLQGLAEGLEIEQGSGEGRVICAMLTLMGDMADQVEDVVAGQGELAQYLDDVDFDLGALEAVVYVDGADDQVYFRPEPGSLQQPTGTTSADQDDEVTILVCPSCGEELAAASGDIEGTLAMVCPACGIICETDEFDEEVGTDPD